ncbi:alpha/beta hydrolase, partial [Williamsia sp.]|uniref:alpha/beta fold hydrolase n=1 Tax=Williamsia sp. TaxID=1872085 RepID=UPI001A265E9F
MPFIDTDTDLYFLDRPADPSLSRGSDILLLHSFGTTARVWEPMLAMFDRRHRVVALDARNHGRSGTSTSSSLNDNVSDVIEVIDRLSLDRPVVVGSSVGALVAITVAARAPGSVRAVVSVGGASHAPVT